MDELQKRAAPPPLSADEERRQRLKAGAPSQAGAALAARPCPALAAAITELRSDRHDA